MRTAMTLITLSKLGCLAKAALEILIVAFYASLFFESVLASLPRAAARIESPARALARDSVRRRHCARRSGELLRRQRLELFGPRVVLEVVSNAVRSQALGPRAVDAVDLQNSRKSCILDLWYLLPKWLILRHFGVSVGIIGWVLR